MQMRVAIFGEVIEEAGGRLGGAVHWTRMVVALGMQPVAFLIGDADQYGRFREEFDELAPGGFVMFFNPERSPNVEYLGGILLSGEQTPIADVAMIVDHTGASFGIDLQAKLEEIGVPWKARHYGDSHKRERGTWGEAIDCVADIQDLVAMASPRELVAA